MKTLSGMDLLELRQVPSGTRNILEMETAPRIRTRKAGAGRLQKEPTPRELARIREDQNAEIEKENTLLMKERFDLFSFFVTLCLPAVIPVKAWDKYHKQKKISEIATSTDEAFAMILLWPIRPPLYWVSVHCAHISRSRPLWESTKNENNNSKISL
jgi:hypothetical protein